MSKEKEACIQATGVVKEAVRGAFIVQLDNSEHVLTCQLAGKMRKNFIRVVAGDRVTVEISQYDLNHGRIIFRSK